MFCLISSATPPPTTDLDGLPLLAICRGLLYNEYPGGVISARFAGDVSGFIQVSVAAIMSIEWLSAISEMAVECRSFSID